MEITSHYGVIYNMEQQGVIYNIDQSFCCIWQKLSKADKFLWSYKKRWSVFCALFLKAVSIELQTILIFSQQHIIFSYNV